MNGPWVVIPTYNEADNVEPMAEALLALSVPNLHLLYVDDASPDGTGAVADRLAERWIGQLHVLHRTGPRGLGLAYVDGFRYALEHGATAIVQMDCDFSHQPTDVPRLLAGLATADIVIGSRYIQGGGTDASWGWARKALSAWANFYTRTLLGVPVHDTTGGFRAYRAEALRGVGVGRVVSHGYIFQVETLYVAWRLGYHVIEVPIFFPDRQRGESKMSLRVQLEAALRVWQVRWRYRQLTPADRWAA